MRKIIAILVFTFALSSLVNAASFSDVKGTKYESSVNMLTDFGIINGYKDGTYKPNNTVTRAEMAKLIIVSLGKEDASETLKGDTKFSDVKAGSWAAGYINYAESKGIIKGYPDGSFKPNNTVSYVEASTMLLRALNYNKELEDKKYPTGYMQTANEAGLLDNVIANSSSEGAIRGNIAIMVLNTLKANTRKIVSTTTSGAVNYGEGDILMETTFPELKYVKEGNVTDVDFEEKEIVVKDVSASNRKVKVVIEDEELLKELYLRKVSFIYNTKSEDIIEFSYIDDYKVIVVDVKDIDGKYIYDDNDNEYRYSDILMYNIYNYDEAETAYITFDKNDDVVCVVLEGTPKVYVGIVDDPSVTVNKEKGVSLYDANGKELEYAFASSSSTKLKEAQVVIYSLDNKEKIIIIDKVVVGDSSNIESLTSDSITLKKEKETKLTEDTEYYVYIVDKSDELREAKFKNIDEEFDKCYIAKIYDVYYLIVFEDSVDTDDIVSKLSVSEAKEKLEAAIKKAKTYIKKESSYSVETYEALNEAYTEGNNLLKTSSSAASLELVERKITQAISDLKSSTSEDKQLRKDYQALQSAISEAESRKASDYTSASYSSLTAALKAAKAIKLGSTTSSKVTTATSNLNKAINMLVTVTASNELQSAINNLKSLITKAENIYKNKAGYTDDSANKLNTALTNAKKLNQSTATLSEVKNQCQNLEAAIDGMVPKQLAEYKTSRNTLDTKYKEVIAIKGDTYTEDSFSKFTTAVNEVKTAYGALASTSDVEAMSNDKVQVEVTKVKELITKIDNAKKLLVSASLDKARTKLKEYIDKGKAIKEADWDASSMTFAELQTLLTNAEKLYNDATKSESDIKAMISELVIALG